CLFAANFIVSAINATVDPCEDFYGFACGKWISCNPIPDGKESISSLEKSEDRLISDISAILNTTTCKYEDQNATDKAIIYYKACLKGATTTEEQEFARGILEANQLEDWPRTPGEGNASETVEQLFGSLGWESLVLIDIVPDKKNVSRHVLMMDQPNMDFLERDELIYQSDSEIVKLNNMYKSIMVKFMMYFK
ncbi:endothelin converting enzyme, putative, partial [Ixodes scapularis]